jgi:hypothetical protein
MLYLKPNTLAGLEPGSSVFETDAMTAEQRRRGDSYYSSSKDYEN